MSENIKLPEDSAFEEERPTPHDVPAMLDKHVDKASTEPKTARDGKATGTPSAASLRANFVDTEDLHSKDWRHDASCLEEDPELFFPIGNTGPALLQVEEAKAVCRRCTVAATCLKWAMDTGQHDGVWGGMSEGERRRLSRRQGRMIRIRDSES